MTNDVDRQKVYIFTPQFEIIGDLSIYPGVRLTDYMNESKPFISVTKAIIKGRENDTMIRTDFLNVRKDAIEIILPENSIRSE